MCLLWQKHVKSKLGNPRCSKDALRQGSKGNSERGAGLDWNLVWILLISDLGKALEGPSQKENQSWPQHSHLYINSWGPPCGSPDSEGNSPATTSHHHRPLPEGLWVFSRRLLLMYRSCQGQTGDQQLGRPMWNWDLLYYKHTHRDAQIRGSYRDREKITAEVGPCCTRVCVCVHVCVHVRIYIHTDAHRCTHTSSLFILCDL